MSDKALEKFVESWGMMGTIWGVNNSVARVHALMIASEEPLSLDDIAAELKISRGNANMCLRELRNWGVIRLVKIPGDRHDYYVTEEDIWKISFAIARERKRREFDPALRVVSETLLDVRKGSSATVERRLKEMKSFLSTVDMISERLFNNERLARKAVALLTSFTKKKA